MRALTRHGYSSGRELWDLGMINDLYVVRSHHWGSPAGRLQFSHHILSLTPTMTKAPMCAPDQRITRRATSRQSAQLLARQRCCPNADGGANWLTCLLPKLGSWRP